MNKVKKSMYLLLKEQIEKYIGIKVLGYVEEDRDLEIQSRYLGLVQSMEDGNIEKIMDKIAGTVEKTIDLDALISMMNKVEVGIYTYPSKRNIKVAIAYDLAFSFYYNENLKLLENACHVEYFSPMEDKKIPNCDLLFLGGGYPELYKKELSQNVSMINSVKEKAEAGGYIYGEAGGFMYLVDSIEGYPMCGILRGKATMTDRLKRFGYVDIELNRDSILGEKGDILRGQEFHRSTIDINENGVFNISKPKSNKNWQCGYKYKNVLGAYPHINFLGNMKVFCNLLDTIEKACREDGKCI